MIKDWELIGKASQFIAEEMGISLKRTAISSNIKERMDHSCAILDKSGRIVAQAEHIPVHLGSFKIGSTNLLQWISSNRIELSDGDMILTNDPYITGTHLNDVMLLAPVHHEDSICAYVVNKAHIVDVGGPVFGSLNPNAKNLYQEGVIIPPVKLVKSGKIDDEIFSIILSNFKEPSAASGDINAQIAANGAGIARIREILVEYGVNAVLSGWNETIKHSRKLAMLAISGWKHGSFYATDMLEAGNSPIFLKLRLDISLILAIPALFAAICALMSPDAADGSLKLESMIERSSWSIFPLFTSFTGGIITPSWYRFFAFGFRLPNTGPPTSTM